MSARNWAMAIPTPEAYWINRVLFDTQHKPEMMASFRNDPRAYLQGMPMTSESKQALIGNDIGLLYRAGANPYLLRAHCLTLQVPEQEYLGALRAIGALIDG